MRILFSLLLLAFVAPALSQGIRINAYGGYVFDDKVDSYYDNTSYYNGTIKGGFQWGVGLEFMIKKDYGLEALYFRGDTKAPMYYYQDGGEKFKEFDLGVNYLMVAGNRYFRKPGSKLEGFGGLMVGINAMNLNNPENGHARTKTYFAWGFRLGGNIWLSENIAIKLQGSLLSAVQSAGGGFYFGTAGAGAGVTSYSSIYQWGLGGGLVFSIPQKNKFLIKKKPVK